LSATNTVQGLNHPVTYDAKTGVLLLGEPAVFTAENVDKFNF
jgi:rhamnose transport system substrate-binding protein